ncbi:dipeptidase PepE [Tenacibaculum sp. nBUS_03]|uniref:dipeptidase PepE n=1 Tax=Tenacibaculum sp. nBUS_03 TaxID=3395320 RepID=UPI003EBD846E
MKKLIVASTSTVHGSGYLEYILPVLSVHFEKTTNILFIPYARPGGISYDAYTEIARKAFEKIGKNVKGIHEFENPKEAIVNATGIFTGGGNTFELVNQLYKNDVLDTLKDALEIGTPYLGTSAGSNICGVTMMNTNDMPIVYPPSFKTLGLIPFNINAHYLDPNPNSKHMGETRETRIKEFHVFNTTDVLGLREGSWLEVNGNKITLKGDLTARLFQKDKLATELATNKEIILQKEKP